jgi:hypothetical protein
MPSGAAISMIAFVIWMSACDGVGGVVVHQQTQSEIPFKEQ